MQTAVYARAVIFAVVFAVFIDARYGSLVLYTLLIALAVSVLVCLASKNNFDLYVSPFLGVFGSDEKFTVNVTVSKKGFCFIPYIFISGSFGKKKFSACGSLMLKGSVTIPIEVTAKGCGLNKFIIDSVKAAEFFKAVRFSRKDIILRSSAAVLPDIIDYKDIQLADSLNGADKELEYRSGSLWFDSDFGCENREYQAGDPIKIINFKLSAKKGRLISRETESSYHRRRFVVQLADNAGKQCVELALGTAYYAVSIGMEAEIVFKNQRFSAGTPEELVNLREWLAFRDFTADNVKSQEK